MKILGVDLGNFSIKVAELDASSKSFTLNNFFEFPISPDPNRDRAIQIIEALRKLTSNYDPSSTRWVIGVPQHRVSVHQKRFPFRERMKIQKSLAFELEDDIPLDVDETIFDVKIVEFIGPSAEVLTIAAPKEVVEEALQVSKDCGFDPEIVAVEGIALANLFTPWNAAIPEISPSLRPLPTEDATDVQRIGPYRSRVILHLGHTRSVMLVYRDSILIATRSILWGGAEIASAISRTFGTSVFESLKILGKSFILMNSSGANQDQLRLSQAVTEQVDFLLKDLRLGLLELKTAFHLEFDEIHLTGGISQIQNIGPYITQGLEISANVNTQLLSRLSSRVPLTPQIESTALIAVGLAIEGLKRPRNPAVNLRKGDFGRENATLRKFWEIWHVPIRVAAAGFAMFFVFAIIRDQIAGGLLTTADEKLAEAGQKAAGLKGSSANESNIRKHIKTQKTLIANQQALSQLDGYLSAMSILARISEKFPQNKSAPGAGFDIALFELENDDLTIQGRAQNTNVAAQIERNLKEIALPKTFQSIPGAPGGFSYRLKVNRKE